jgi:hypothetical protein
MQPTTGSTTGSQHSEDKKAEDVVAAANDGTQAVLDAWHVSGPGKEMQYRAKRELFKTWPTLALAIERLADDHYLSK